MSYCLKDEQKTQSEFSPGLVRDEEWLLRLAFSPEHVREGCIIPTALSIQDLKERGYSLDRQLYVSKSIVEERSVSQGKKLMEAKNKEQRPLLGKLQCVKVREILFSDPTERACFVIDNAIKNNKAHAAIFSTRKNQGSLRKLRVKLIEILNTNTFYEIEALLGN